MSTAPNTFVDAPKIARIKVAPCTSGGRHKYGDDGVCKVCGAKNPWPNRTTRVTKEGRPARPSPVVVSQLKARAIIFGATGLTQRLALQLIEEESREEWEKDALSAEELLLLSDALADEAVRSKRILAWLAALDNVGPHAKLATVVGIILLPRMARRGIIPENVANELVAAASLALASGPPRNDNRRDVRWEVDSSGGGSVTSPKIPTGESFEDGPGQASGTVPGGGGFEEPQDSAGREVQPDRTEAESADAGEPGAGVLPGVSNGVAPGRMDRVRRRRVVP